MMTSRPPVWWWSSSHAIESALFSSPHSVEKSSIKIFSFFFALVIVFGTSKCYVEAQKDVDEQEGDEGWTKTAKWKSWEDDSGWRLNFQMIQSGRTTAMTGGKEYEEEETWSCTDALDVARWRWIGMKREEEKKEWRSHNMLLEIREM